jgi:hypothetical protein
MGPSDAMQPTSEIVRGVGLAALPYKLTDVPHIGKIVRYLDIPIRSLDQSNDAARAARKHREEFTISRRFHRMQIGLLRGRQTGRRGPLLLRQRADPTADSVRVPADLQVRVSTP